MLNFFRDRNDENDGTYRGGEGGKEGPLCDPGSDLLLGGRARASQCEDNKFVELTADVLKIFV